MSLSLEEGCYKVDEKDKVKTFTSRNGSEVTVVGEPNIDRWARKIKQVLDDLDAGKFKVEENNEKPTDN